MSQGQIFRFNIAWKLVNHSGSQFLIKIKVYILILNFFQEI